MTLIWNLIVCTLINYGNVEVDKSVKQIISKNQIQKVKFHYSNYIQLFYSLIE